MSPGPSVHPDPPSSTMLRGSPTVPAIPRASVPSARLGRPAVLVLDDDREVAEAYTRMLRDVAVVTVADDAGSALDHLATGHYDVLLSDVEMPLTSGTELLRQVRARDLDLPVIFVTGRPTVESAAEAVELGAFRFLTKPVSAAHLQRVVQEAFQVRELSRRHFGDRDDRAELARTLRSAIARLTMAYQPIVTVASHQTLAYEALMRSGEPALPSPPAILAAAEKLGALHLLGRHVRNLVAAQLDQNAGADVYVNLHPADLADPDLYDPSAPLSRHARRVILEVTERATLECVPDIEARRRALGAMGYRLAVDDLGAGYAGLSYFARLCPDVVKIDMSLVRDMDIHLVKQRVVHSLVLLATQLGMETVAEGVETVGERETAVRLGCTYVQGYLLGRPGHALVPATWTVVSTPCGAMT